MLATIHSSTTVEALQRLVSAFAPEIQQSMCAQLADVLVGAVAQRLHFHAGQKMQVPECEVLMATTATRAVIRSGQFFKLQSTIETGAADGSYTFSRYGEWLARKTEFVVPTAIPEVEAPETPVIKPAVRAVSKKSDDGVMAIEEAEDLSTIIAALEKE